MWSRGLGIVAMVAGMSAMSAAQQQAPPVPVGAMIGYEDFMKLEAPQRTERFGAMSPENKPSIIQAHAQAWLRKNGGRLTAGQVALVQEAIAFATPDLYRTPHDPEQLKKEQALEAKLRCGLRRSDLLEVFGALSPPVRRASWFNDLWVWLEDCVVG